MRLFSNNEQEVDNNITNINPNMNEPISSQGSTDFSFQSNPHIEEDSLLVQIDEFRKKAESLQSLINDRQHKVNNLEAIVRERESKNIALQNELSKKQEALHEVLEDITSQLDNFANRIDTSVNNTIEEAKEPIIEKIHSENVRLYRNIYDFIKEDYDVDEIESSIVTKTKSGNVLNKVNLVLTIINTIFIVLLVLYTFEFI